MTLFFKLKHTIITKWFSILSLVEMGYLFQYLATFSALIIIMSGGMHYAWPSPSIPILLNSTHSSITSDEGSWMAIMVLIGGPIGGVLATLTVNCIGRKSTILLGAPPILIAWLLIAFLPKINGSVAPTLYLARFLAGFAEGITFTSIPIYIGEISNPKIRGLLGSSISSTWILGMLLINVLGSYLDIKTTALISTISPIIFLLTFVWMPESPYQLISKHNYEAARKSLIKFDSSLSTDDVHLELNRLKAVVHEQTRKAGRFSDLFTKPSNRKGLIILMILRSGQQLSGTAAISFYTVTIFQQSNDVDDSFLSPEIATFSYVSMQIIMGIICSLAVDKTGRRPLLFVSIIVSGLSLCGLGTFFHFKDNVTDIDTSQFNYIPVILLLVYAIAFNLGMQSIPLLMVGELFSIDVKAFAACYSEVYFCAMASLVSKLFQITKDTYGMFLPFYFFSASCFIDLIFIVIYVPETRGKTLEEIQELLKNNKKCVLPNT